MPFVPFMMNKGEEKKSKFKSDQNYKTPWNVIRSKFSEYKVKCLEEEGFKVNRPLTEARKKIDI